MIPIGWLIAAMALQAAGSYTQHRAQQAALRRQGELAAAASRFQGEIGKKGQRALNQQVEQYGADERGEGLQQQEEDLTGYLSSPWGEDSTTLPAPAQTGGNVSAKFTRDVALASAAELEGARAAAARLAKHMAPTYLRTQEGYGVADLASSLGMLRSIAQGQEAVDRQRIAMVQPNAGQMMTGQLLGALGQGLGLYGAMSAGSGTPGVIDWSGFGADPTTGLMRHYPTVLR